MAIFMPVSLQIHIQSFIEYLQFEKRYSPHTAIAYRNDLEQFEAYLLHGFQMDSIADVNTSIVRSWMASLKNDGQDSAKTIRRKISSLKSFYRYLLRENSVSQSPVNAVTLPKINKRIPTFLPQSETEWINKEKEPDAAQGIHFSDGWKGQNERLILHLLYATGMRLSELINLQEANIDFNYQQAKILGKGNKERIIPLGKELLQEIRTYMSGKPVTENATGNLLVNDNGKALYPKYVYNITTHLLGDITTLKKKSPHILRHTFATQLMNNGADINSVKELLGHSSLAATQVYTHNTIEKLKEIFKQAHPKG